MVACVEPQPDGACGSILLDCREIINRTEAACAEAGAGLEPEAAHDHQDER
jgi:hypothetical protein